MVAPGPEAVQPEPDPESFASMARFHAPPPDAWEVAVELRSRLTPAREHRVRWRPAVAATDDLEIADPRQLLDQAIAGLPG